MAGLFGKVFRKNGADGKAETAGENASTAPPGQNKTRDRWWSQDTASPAFGQPEHAAPAFGDDNQRQNDMSNIEGEVVEVISETTGAEKPETKAAEPDAARDKDAETSKTDTAQSVTPEVEAEKKRQSPNATNRNGEDRNDRGRNNDADDAKLLTDTAGPSRAGLVMFILLFGVAGGWSATAKISGAVIASGAVSVKGSAKAVQHLDGGIVTDIVVKNSDLVDKGSVLIRLDDTALLADLTIYGNRLNEAVSRKSRLEAELDGLDEISWSAEIIEHMQFAPNPEARAQQRELFLARRQSLSSKLDTLRERMAQFESQYEGIVSVNASLRKQRDLLTEEHDKLQTLYELGYVGGNRVLSVERQIAELEGRLGSSVAELSQTRKRIDEIRLEIKQIQTEFNAGAVAELEETEREIRELLEVIPVTREKLERVELRAPATGTVHELSVFTVGGVIGAGQVVMEIVPLTEELEFEVAVDPQFIDQIYVDQPVEVRFPAMNARRTPKLVGRVVSVSPDKLVDDASQMAFYQIMVTVPRSELVVLGDKKLVPGMPVETFMQTEPRTPLNYLLRPLADGMSRSMREE